jgi:hypothetical protein
VEHYQRDDQWRRRLRTSHLHPGAHSGQHPERQLARRRLNILKGNWRAVVYVDDKASEEQQQALLDVYTGSLGGPVADFAQLVGEVVAVERAPFTISVKDGKGSLKIGDAIEAEMEPYKGATGASTTLSDTAFSTIPGSPAYVSKSPKYRAIRPDLGIDVDLQGHNAVQGSFLFEG